MAIRSTDLPSRRVRDNFNQNVMGKGFKIPAGIYRGIVVNNSDPEKKGRVKVNIMKFYGIAPADTDPGTATDGSEWKGAMWCRQALPYGGTTIPSESGGQDAYGSFGPPPDQGNEVVVAFGGDMHSGIIIGVLPDMDRTSGMAGAGVTQTTASGETTIGQETAATANSSSIPAPEHPQAERLRVQGLSGDRIRGQNYSSPTRDVTPRVTGMSSPVGHAIVMDDGSDEDGDSLRMQFRTAGGAQILMDDTNGLTYLINREGNVWIEMNRNGDLDIYAASSINYHTEGDFNLHCGGNFNLQTGRDIQMKALGAQGIKLEATNGSFNMKCAANMNLQADANGNIRVAGNYRETASRIDMNGPAAAAAAVPQINQLAGNTSVTESVSRRVPEAEPWAGHLDVSTLDSSSASGAAQSSQSYYYGTPSESRGYNDQTGQFEEPFGEADDTYPNLQWAPGIDRRVNPKVLQLANQVAQKFGTIFTINSGFRDPARNTAAGGAKRSQHMLGNAIDIGARNYSNNERLEMIAYASSIGIKGIGLYNSGNMHFDVRDGARAGWGNDYTQASTPSYAVSAMNKHRSGGFA